MLLPFVAMVAFGFVLGRWMGSWLKTRREVISRDSSQKIRQADKKYLRACGGRAFVFFGFFGVRGDSGVCRTWLTLHISRKLETT